MTELSLSKLGKQAVYEDQYNPDLLFAISRADNRINIGININALPFVGYDIWNGFDFTWLDLNSVPQFGVLTIYVPCDSPNLIESKSLKLYLFSFANSTFASLSAISSLIEQDLSRLAQKPVRVELYNRSAVFANIRPGFAAENLDSLDINCDQYEVDNKLLASNKHKILIESLCSDLLRSNCLVTGQPDWASLRITYTGPQIDRVGLLKYIISYRNHRGFHEQCIEQIYIDILQICKPEYLSVEGRYTRRGGLDINPVRSNFSRACENFRLFRQ